MRVKVSFGKELFEFNLNEELIVNENKINTEVKEQPNSYAFLSMLAKKLLRVYKDSEKQMEKKFSELYVKYKKKLNPATQRPYDKDYAYHIANSNPDYQELKDKFLKAKSDYDTIETCVKSFEQRAFLIQTLSANIRKEH